MMAIQLATRRFTVREFQRMVEAGVFTEDERVELLDGAIVPMSPTSPRHAAHMARIGERLWVAAAPRSGGYAQVEALRRADGPRRLALPGLPDLSVAVGDVLGPPSA